MLVRKTRCSDGAFCSFRPFLKIAHMQHPDNGSGNFSNAFLILCQRKEQTRREQELDLVAFSTMTSLNWPAGTSWIRSRPRPSAVQKVGLRRNLTSSKSNSPSDHTVNYSRLIE